MPLTSFQSEVLAVIAVNRNEESHFAGGLVLHAAANSARFSHDFDIFHEADEQVAQSSDADVTILEKAGFVVEKIAGNWLQPTSFRKGRIRRGTDSVEID